MRLSISNIAWDISEDEAVANLLRHYHIDAIDVAPGKYFSEPKRAGLAEIKAVKNWWAARDIEIVGMQALLFGTQGLNVFGDAEVQANLLDHLSAVCRIGAGLGARCLVFGSPKNRDRSGLDDKTAEQLGVAFFQRLGDIAAAHQVTICLEPNPPCYSANFMTTSAETEKIVRLTDHPSIKMQLDTGALTINQEQPAEVIKKNVALISHIHASEPDLLPLGDGTTDHQAICALLQRYLPHHIVSIEMVATKNEPHLTSIERALIQAIAHYKNGKIV